MPKPPDHIEIIARGVAIHPHSRRGAAVLMCRSKKRGYYYLPGGHVEPGEPAATALQREILEEMGIHSTIGPPLCLHECAFHDGKSHHHELNVVFHVAHLGAPGSALPDQPPCAEDHIAFEWLPLASLDEFDIRPIRAREWLQAHAATLKSGGIPGFEWLSDMGQS